MRSLLCYALVILGGCNSINRPRDGLPAERPWGPASAGLRMAVWTTPSDTIQAAAPHVHVGIENVGESDVVLNLGIMLANGRRMYPLAIALVLTDTTGKIRPLTYPDPAVGGRVDDYLVALRAGSRYSLRLGLEQYYSTSADEYPLKLAPGSYRIEARLAGREARAINLDTQGIALLNFWTGTLRSNVATFTLR